MRGGSRRFPVHEAKDLLGLKALLEELDALPLTWEPWSEPSGKIDMVHMILANICIIYLYIYVYVYVYMYMYQYNYVYICIYI